jgi:hypothetical protein
VLQFWNSERPLFRIHSLAVFQCPTTAQGRL